MWEAMFKMLQFDFSFETLPKAVGGGIGSMKHCVALCCPAASLLGTGQSEAARR